MPSEFQASFSSVENQRRYCMVQAVENRMGRPRDGFHRHHIPAGRESWSTGFPEMSREHQDVHQRVGRRPSWKHWANDMVLFVSLEWKWFIGALWHAIGTSGDAVARATRWSTGRDDTGDSSEPTACPSQGIWLSRCWNPFGWRWVKRRRTYGKSVSKLWMAKRDGIGQLKSIWANKYQ